MNINIDNYEAYLVDYLDGQLSETECRQLKQFVARQGLDFDELVKDLPELEPKTVTYEHKDSLKKKAKVIPLLTKIATAAAAVTLLFVLFWNQNEIPTKQLPLAETQTQSSQPIENEPTIKTEETPMMEGAEALAEAETTQQKVQVSKPKPAKAEPIEAKPIEAERSYETSPLLATLKPVSAHEVQFSDDFLVENDMLPQTLVYPMYMDENTAENIDLQTNEKHSWFEKGILWASNGKCTKLGELFQYGFNRASHEVIHYTAKAALTAYYTIDERIEETKERHQEEPEE